MKRTEKSCEGTKLKKKKAKKVTKTKYNLLKIKLLKLLC